MKIGMLLADLHFGAVEKNQFTTEIHSIIDKMRSMEQLDYIVFLGDLFDHKMYVGDPHITNVVMFIRAIMTIAMNRKIKVRMVYGTESHECDQYILFKGYETIEGLDFKIIHEVCEENLFPDMKVLYVPEEYITTSKTEYYGEYFHKRKEYDYIFGHGVIIEGMKMITDDKNTQWMTARSPKFAVSDFTESLKGEIYFGHFHVHTEITKKVNYVGSYSRWCHGEEDPKGYMIITKVDDSYFKEFIENPEATLYKTISFGYNSSIFKEDVDLENHIRGLDRMISTYPEGTRARLLLNIPEDYSNPEFFMEYLKEKYRMNPLVSLEFVNGYVDKKRKKDKEELHHTIEQYDYILNRKDSIGETVSRFIADKLGKNISPEKVTFYLTQNLQDILNTTESS